MRILSALPFLALLWPTLAASAASDQPLTKEARLAFIQKAQVWTQTDVPAMDLRAGPQGRGALMPNETVTCDYVPIKLSGSSRKFDCTIGKGDVAKVKYGA